MDEKFEERLHLVEHRIEHVCLEVYGLPDDPCRLCAMEQKIEELETTLGILLQRYIEVCQLLSHMSKGGL